MVKMTRLTQRRHPGASPQRERKRVLKMLFDETGLKSPIFYSEDFAIDGAAMPEKLCAMQWKASSQRMSRHRTGWGGMKPG
jgi:hypothetical protein